MSYYVFAYHGGKIPESPEEGAKRMAKIEAWVGGLGDAVVNPGHPLGKSKTVSSSGVSDDGRSNPLVGFSIVKADSMDAALEMAKGYPHLETGTVEVVEMMEPELPKGGLDVATAIDPICQMQVDTDSPPGGLSEYQGATYYFCAPVCKVAFDQEPDKYLSGQA